LYNLEDDPEEKNDIINEISSQKVLRELETWALQLVSEMVPVNFGISTSLGFPNNSGGFIGSGWCRAVHSSGCSNDALPWSSLVSKTASSNGFSGVSKDRLHLYTAGKAFLYQSPLLPNVTRACYVQLENGDELDEILDS